MICLCCRTSSSTPRLTLLASRSAAGEREGAEAGQEVLYSYNQPCCLPANNCKNHGPNGVPTPPIQAPTHPPPSQRPTSSPACLPMVGYASRSSSNTSLSSTLVTVASATSRARSSKGASKSKLAELLKPQKGPQGRRMLVRMFGAGV
jgi:hypothetical protein